MKPAPEEGPTIPGRRSKKRGSKPKEGQVSRKKEPKDAAIKRAAVNGSSERR